MFTSQKSPDFTLLPEMAVPFIRNLSANFKEIEGLRLSKTPAEVLWCFALALIMTDRVKELDLSGALYPEPYTEDNRYDAIAVALTYNKSIKHLRLDDCHFTLSGAEKIANALRVSHIRTVSLARCRFDGNGKELLRDAMHLSKLDKYSCEQIDQLAQTIYKENSKNLEVEEVKPKAKIIMPQQKSLFSKTTQEGMVSKKAGDKKYGFGSRVPRF